MLKLMFASEKSLGKLRIEDWFSHTFFESNFWFIFTTMFAFQKWSSVIEMKRYMERFIHLLPGLEKLQGVMRTKYDQYHSVALPIATFPTVAIGPWAEATHSVAARMPAAAAVWAIVCGVWWGVV